MVGQVFQTRGLEVHWADRLAVWQSRVMAGQQDGKQVGCQASVLVIQQAPRQHGGRRTSWQSSNECGQQDGRTARRQTNLLAGQRARRSASGRPGGSRATGFSSQRAEFQRPDRQRTGRPADWQASGLACQRFGRPAFCQSCGLHVQRPGRRASGTSGEQVSGTGRRSRRPASQKDVRPACRRP
jgi:hypothetical protein